MDLNTNKKVLVKHPFKKFPSPSLVENFRKEYQFGKALYELFPENFVNVIELIETSGTVALVQEPEGASLAEIITTKGKFKLEEFLEYSISITDSLAKLHSNNMIHQDIKPANIVLGENGKLKIIDLGITVIVSRKSPSISTNSPVTLASFQFDLGFDNLLSVLSMFEETKEIPENYQNPDLSNKWLFQLKSNIDDQVDLYGGVSQIFDKMKYCDDEEMILLQKILAETSDLVILCEKATPTFVLTCPLVALYLSLKNGFTENALSGFSFGAVYLSTFFRDPKGREMYFLVEKLKQIMKNYQVSIVEFSQAANCQFAGNVKGNIQHCEAALKYSMSHSEYIYCGYAMFYSCVNSSFSGMHAQTVISKAKNYQSYILATGNMYGHGYFESVINFTEDISGLKAFSPQYKIPNWVTLKGCAPTYDSYKGILEYYACDYDSAMSFFDSAEKRISDVFGFPFYYECQMYQLLTWTEVYSQKKDNELKERIETRLKDFKELGKLGPFYFQPRYEIMCHAYASSKDDSDTISLIKSFEETIKACQKYYLILPSAVAATILLRHLVKKKFPSSVCQMYFNNIVETYDNIQAKGMITYLLKEFPSFSIRRSSSSGITITEKKVSLLKKEEKNDLFEYLTASKKDEILSLIASKYSNEINEYLNNKK
eukprot:gene4538-7915_t